MQVSVESTSELSRKLNIQVPEAEIQEKIETRLKSMAGRVKVDGFRPGKVPRSVLKKQYGGQVREEILSDMIQTTFESAVRQEKLKPAGPPQIIAHKAEEGEGLEYDAIFEVMPEFVVMPLETLAVKRYVSDVTDADVETMVDRLRDQRKTWNAVERASADGDRVTIAFEGWEGEESFTNGRVDDFAVLLGAKQMIPGFEEKLVGVATGEHHEFELAFPEDYPSEKLAGKTGRFVVDVTKVEEPVLPELNDEFVKAFGIEEGGVDAFRADIRGNMEREMRRALKTRSKGSVMDALYGSNPLTLPNVMIQDELNSLAEPYRDSAKQQKQILDEAKLKEHLDPVARRRVALALILSQLIDSYAVKLDANRVRDTVYELAQSYEDPEEVVRWYYADRTRLREVENLVMEDQIVDVVLEKANAAEEQIDFQALMQSVANNAPPSV